MSWEDIIKKMKQTLRKEDGKEQTSSSLSSMPRSWERRREEPTEAKRLPDQVVEYLKQKRKELREKVKEESVKKELIGELKEEIIGKPKVKWEPIEPPKPSKEVPCGGTCAVGQKAMEETVEPSSWFEAQAMKQKQWLEDIKEKKEELKEKAADLPWQKKHELMKSLPWDVAAEVPQTEGEELTLTPTVVRKEGLIEQQGLPWMAREKSIVNLDQAVNVAKGHLHSIEDAEVQSARERGEEPDDEEISTDAEDVLDELLTNIADLYKEKYEPMRQALSRLSLPTKYKLYLGEKFQDDFNPDYDAPTPEDKKRLHKFAEAIWEKNDQDIEKASDELEKLLHTLQIDGVEYQELDSTLTELSTEHEKKLEEVKEQQRMKKVLTMQGKYHGMPLTHENLDKLAEDLIEEFLDYNESDTQLEKFNLPDEDYHYVTNKLEELNDEKMATVSQDITSTAADRGLGVEGAMQLIQTSDELTDSQKEFMIEQLSYDANEEVGEVMGSLPDTIWEDQIQRVKDKMVRNQVSDLIGNEVIEQISADQTDSLMTLKDAGLLDLSYQEQKDKIEAMHMPEWVKERLQETVDDIAMREAKTRELTEKSKRKEELQKKLDKYGEVHEKRKGGYVFHLIPKKGKKLTDEEDDED